MVLTQTNTKDFKLGSQAPHFALPEPLTGGTVSLDDVRGTNGTLVVFLSNHCPFVIHIQAELNRLGSDLKQMGIGMVGISASDVRAYPQDGPDIMKSVAETRLTTFPYLYDETQVISKQFKALCTPDFYLFDKNLRLAYRGRLDSSSPGNKLPTTGEDLRAAAKCLINGEQIDPERIQPSRGCSIKWFPGKEPDYFLQ